MDVFGRVNFKFLASSIQKLGTRSNSCNCPTIYIGPLFGVHKSCTGQSGDDPGKTGILGQGGQAPTRILAPCPPQQDGGDKKQHSTEETGPIWWRVNRTNTPTAKEKKEY